MTDPQARILWVNRAACEISGYAEQEILGMTPAIFSSGKQSRRSWPMRLASVRAIIGIAAAGV